MVQGILNTRYTKRTLIDGASRQCRPRIVLATMERALQWSMKSPSQAPSTFGEVAGSGTARLTPRRSYQKKGAIEALLLPTPPEGSNR